MKLKWLALLVLAVLIVLFWPIRIEPVTSTHFQFVYKSHMAYLIYARGINLDTLCFPGDIDVYPWADNPLPAKSYLCFQSGVTCNDDWYGQAFVSFDLRQTPPEEVWGEAGWVELFEGELKYGEVYEECAYSN